MAGRPPPGLSLCRSLAQSPLSLSSYVVDVVFVVGGGGRQNTLFGGACDVYFIFFFCTYFCRLPKAKSWLKLFRVCMCVCVCVHSFFAQFAWLCACVLVFVCVCVHELVHFYLLAEWLTAGSGRLACACGCLCMCVCICFWLKIHNYF